MPFNQELWDLGQKIENKTLPLINKHYECEFERNINDIFDVLDFKDEDKKIIVEIKGRRNSSEKYEDTMISSIKITEGNRMIELGYQVFFVFVFTDKTMEIELKLDQEWKCMVSGTNSILHYFIPIKDLTEINMDD